MNMEAVDIVMHGIMVEDSHVTGNIFPKAAAPATFLASTFRIILQELSSQLLRLLQVNQKTWKATDPTVSIKNGG